jgi:hypothetical protein
MIKTYYTTNKRFILSLQLSLYFKLLQKSYKINKKL